MSVGKKDYSMPPALVLSREGTGFATVRGLSEGRMPITAITYVGREPIHYSRLCRIVEAPGFESDDRYMQWLAEHCMEQPERPVLFPTCDADALLLTRYAELLQPVASTWSTSFKNLTTIVDKSALYALAASAGIPTIPSLREPTREQVERWCAEYEPPYFLKPFYAAVPQCAIDGKNKRFRSAPELLDFVSQYGTRACVLQRQVAGGDGYIFDTYGLSDFNNRIVSYANHRRWRQFPPHVGVTCCGEIPVRSVENVDVLFDYTERLVRRTKYHGIFGIEWLLDRKTRQWYLIDFNARPFSSIGHLVDCGLNLPLLAYNELIGRMPPHVPQRPSLAHSYWLNLKADLSGLMTRSDISFFSWLRSVLRCRSFAYWSWRDPGPQIYRFWELARLVGRAVHRVARPRFNNPAAIPRSVRSVRI